MKGLILRTETLLGPIDIRMLANNVTSNMKDHGVAVLPANVSCYVEDIDIPEVIGEVNDEGDNDSGSQT